ncbi:histone-lysine N-methyltransferase SETMAR [Trichonephila clavipes]|nr:histone-lysine N-methyltransferase SETMAR [Trichonephila clavipes]
MVAPSVVIDTDTCATFDVPKRQCGFTPKRLSHKLSSTTKHAGDYERSEGRRRGVIRILTVEGVGDHEMHRRMKTVLGEYSLRRSNVVEGHRRFLEGLLNNHRITVEEIHWLLGLSVGTTHIMMHQRLNFRKICEQWVPHQQTDKQRNTRMTLSLSKRYYEEKYYFLSQIVTSDET